MTVSSRRLSAVLGATIAVAMVVLGGCSLFSEGGSVPGSTAGSTPGGTPISAEPAPDFSGVTLDGLSVSLSEYRGRPLVLVFMASWCGPCAAESPELDRFYREYSDRAGLLAMAVNDSEEAMRAFMSEGGWGFPVMMGADSAAAAYGVRFIPAVFVIDAEGRIVETIVGGTTASDLSLLVDGLAP
jgi:thiol-disulfide isomerase/thioredoxin